MEGDSQDAYLAFVLGYCCNLCYVDGSAAAMNTILIGSLNGGIYGFCLFFRLTGVVPAPHLPTNRMLGVLQSILTKTMHTPAYVCSE